VADLLSFISGQEGFSPKAFPDYKQYSNGFGTRARYPGEVIDRAEAQRRLEQEVAKAQGYVTSSFGDLAPDKQKSLTSFTYNLGPDWITNGSRMSQAVKAGDWQTAANVMQEYNKAGGKTLPGLVSRRRAEGAMLLGGPTPDETASAPEQGQPMAYNFSNLPGAQYLAKRGQPQETSSIDPSAPPMMQSGGGKQPGLIDALMNPLTIAGLTILGSPTRDVGDGFKTGFGLIDPNKDIDRKYKEALTQKAMREATDAGATFGKTGNIFQDPVSKKFYSVQFGSNGQKLVEEIGGGLTPSRGVGEVDTGTGTEIIDKATGLPIRNVAKDVAGAASQKTQGELRGAAVAALPGIESTADRAIETINKIRNHPGKQYGVGAAGVLPGIPGTQQKGFVTLVDQAKGQTFLEAFNSLRGGGAITESEGRKATEAFARLDRAQTQEDFDAGLADLEAVIKEGVRVARIKAGGDTLSGRGSQSFVDGAGAPPAASAPNGFSIRRID
jgi:GH24 family phage-related lysozyme (muramidase)